MYPDTNLLFGALALQVGLLDAGRFAEACTAWAAQKGGALADVLVERGWLTAADRATVERLLQLKLQQHAGDVSASLAELADAKVRRALAALDDTELRESLPHPPEGNGHVLLTTLTPEAGEGERYTLTRLHAEG